MKSAQAAAKRRRWIRLIVAVAAVVFLSHWSYQRHKERRFDPIIVAAAKQYGTDPALVKAVIWRESKFDPKARGRVGEMGLMQLREAAAYEWAAAEKKTNFSEDQLADPDTNIFAGTWYLAHLLRRYRALEDPMPYALADYNAGRTHVLRWMRGAARTNSAEFVAQIDFPGTRRYIQSVQERHARYQRDFRHTGK